MRDVHQVQTRDQSAIFLFAAFAIAIILMAMNWVGYDGADDLSYAQSAQAWLNHFPTLGTNHWALRYTIVLPVAASLWLLGQHEFALCLPNVIFFLGFIYVNHHFATRIFGVRTGAILALLLALTPSFLVQATYINLDLVEAFFVSLSFWLFLRCATGPRQHWMAFWSGVTAGLAVMTRETSIVLLAVFALNFLFSPSRARKLYIWLGLGFLLVIFAEFAFFGVMSGDILYRFRLDAHHDAVNRALSLQQTQARGQVLDKEGGLSVNVALDPILALFASQKFGLLFYIALPLGIWLNRLRGLSATERQSVRLVSLLAVSWILFISLASSILYVVPRYFIVPAWACLVLIAYGCHKLLEARRGAMVMLAIGGLLAVNAISLYVENTNPRYAERVLVQYLRTHPGQIVHTDPDTDRRASLLASFSGVADRVSMDPVKAGDIYFYNERKLTPGSGVQSPESYRPKPGWPIVGRIQEQPRLAGKMLRAVHLDSVIPPQVFEKIERPSPTLVIYRVSYR